MKNLILFSLITLAMVACNPSPEKKVESLIKEEVKKNLIKPDSYDPIETKVDSAFAPYDDPDLYEEFVKLDEYASKCRGLETRLKEAKRDMAYYKDFYGGSYFKEKYKEAVQTYNDTEAAIEEEKENIQKQCGNIMEIIRGERTFIGYKAYHSYRAKNNNDNIVINSHMLFIDKEIKNITHVLGVEEYKEFRSAIEQLKNR